ncbi:MAG: hypothetical protein AAF621_07830 [Pseudomonadota bacterium]
MEQDISQIKYFRSLIEHEDNLINHRTSWLLVSQSFILAACITAGHVKEPIIWFNIILVIFSLYGNVAAINAHNEIKRLYDNWDQKEDYHLTSKGLTYWLGCAPSLIIPYLFLMLWWCIWLSQEHFI